jgi:hypothetical protein
VDVNTKDKMNSIPLTNKDMQALFRKKYTITKTTIDGNTDRLNFETKQYFDSVSTAMVNIGLQYSGKKFIPQLLEMDVQMKQLLADEQVQQLKNQGANTDQVIQKIGNDNYFIREQKVTVAFSDIDNSKEKAMQMPSWKNKLNYDSVSNEFSGKGIYSDYEITKTF